MAAPAVIARYYDRNTRRFLRHGGSGDALAIHRPLWAPGIVTAEAAAGHVNDLCAETAERLLGRPPGRVADLGCGVGGTLLHLARRWPLARLEGLTISPEQARIAARHAGSRGLGGRVAVQCGDFLQQEAGRAGAELVVAIESHVHAPDAAAFLRAAAGRLAPGGVLLVVDDMLSRPEAELTGPQRRRISAIRQGWRLGHLGTADGLSEAAAADGLAEVARRDLTGWLHLYRLRDRALRVAGPLADVLGLGRWPLFGNMIGGNALTCAYREGLMRYTLLAFRVPGG